MAHHTQLDHPGDILAQRRSELQLTQTDLSKMLGYNFPNFISVIEAKKSAVPLERIPAIAEALEMNPLWFAEKVIRSKDRGENTGWNELADVLFDPAAMRHYADDKERAAAA